MCGRAVLTVSGEELRKAFGLTEVPEMVPRFNIAPTQPIAVIREPGRLELVRWGLPSQSARGGTRVNVRAESVATAHRAAFGARRCLVVVDGFYEWRHDPNEGHGRGRPFVVRREDGAHFALAGIWERHVDGDGEVIDSCAVVTGPARGVAATIHDRMPVVVPGPAYLSWLAGDAREASQWLATRADELTAYEVTSYVSSPSNDDARCLEPATAAPPSGNLTLFR